MPDREKMFKSITYDNKIEKEVSLCPAVKYHAESYMVFDPRDIHQDIQSKQVCLQAWLFFLIARWNKSERIISGDQPTYCAFRYVDGNFNFNDEILKKK